jgi:predicted nucleotidyltransferase
MKFVTKILNEEFERVDSPAYKVDEISTLYEDVIKNLNANLKIPKDVMDSFKLKDELNPEVWTNDKLNLKVKHKLIRIAKDFYNELELPPNMKLKDILFVGSLANYNWSKFSDIDLHLVVDFSLLDDDPEQTKKRFDAEKNLWNLKHDVKVFDYPVEVYVQDIKEKVEATAIYSIPHDKWIAKPKHLNFRLDKNNIKRKVDKLFNRLKDIKHDYDTHKFDIVAKKAENLKDSIKKMRKSGLEAGGEFASENLVFKVLRRTNFMEMLDEFRTKAYDKMVSVNEE